MPEYFRRRSTVFRMKKLSSKTSLILIVAVFAIVLCVALIIVIHGYRSQVKWYTDYETARDYALKTNRDIFLVFEGASWDESSSQLMADILDKESFLGIIGKKFVPCRLEIPLDDGETTFSEQQNKNLEISRVLAIPEIPTILFLTAYNQIYDTVSYTPGTSYEVIEKAVADASEKSKQIASLNDMLIRTSGVEKVNIIDKLVSITPQDYIFQFYNLINTIPEIDPKNESGLVGKYTLIITHVTSLEMLFNGNAEGAAKVYAEAAENPLFKPEEKLEAYYKAATMCYYGGLNDLLKEYLTKAIAADPESENASILKNTLDSFIAEELESTLALQNSEQQ